MRAWQVVGAAEPREASEPMRRVSTPGRRTIEEVEASSGGWTFAKLTIANGALRELAAQAGG